ncbi:equilibrative nucleobase transporter 1-like isoform X2 [Dunckerocampus dactyliophorus]|uniref:equilibrative nucleobase transporter 1-like isoform X2 n=1 Tax=Dunckerocampus dactyliophorus TaxID=161453 RepID=UPI0024057926|nr:equilibrative nucleobase transporter 1-like isoform X2 [Dunckerocampus dactyliophorus]
MLMCQKWLGVRRALSLVTGLVECLCFAGIQFGWVSLVFILKTQGFFSSRSVNTTGINGSQVLDCTGQDEQFSLVFTIASFLNTFVTLPNGFIFDRFGTTVARLYGISVQPAFSISFLHKCGWHHDVLHQHAGCPVENLKSQKSVPTLRLQQMKGRLQRRSRQKQRKPSRLTGGKPSLGV